MFPELSCGEVQDGAAAGVIRWWLHRGKSISVLIVVWILLFGKTWLMDLDERLGLVIKRAEQTLIRAKSQALAPFDLTVPQYAALLVVGEEAGVTAAELARRCLVTPQTMTTVLRNVSGKGLVERRPHPTIGHVQQTFLTPQGLGLLKKADAAAVSVEQQLVASMSSSDRNRFRELLECCISNLEDDQSF